MLRLSKQANDEIRRLEESRNRNIVEQREKRQADENQNAIEFWIATARHWHKRATFLEGVAQRERDTTTQAVTEMEIQSVERHHWKQCAEQNHGDVMAAEARTDAMGDILDALARGWRMESYDGCAKWWRYDTDTLQALAKEAREWEQAEDSKPLTQIYIGNGEGEPFTMGDQQFVPECEPVPDQAMSRDDMIAFIEAAYSQGMPMQINGVHTLADTALQNEFELAHRFVTATNERREREAVQQAARTATDGKAWTRWEWEYKPNSLDDADTVDIVTHDGKTNNLEAGIVDWAQVKSYRVAESQPADQTSPIDDGKEAQHADGFNGNMIGTDGDRVGFIWHAAKYGFKSEYNPESATSAQIEDDYSRAFAYMQANCYPLKPQ